MSEQRTNPPHHYECAWLPGQDELCSCAGRGPVPPTPSPIPTPEYVLTAETLVRDANLHFVNPPTHTSKVREMVTDALRAAYNDGFRDGERRMGQAKCSPADCARRFAAALVGEREPPSEALVCDDCREQSIALRPRNGQNICEDCWDDALAVADSASEPSVPFDAVANPHEPPPANATDDPPKARTCHSCGAQWMTDAEVEGLSAFVERRAATIAEQRMADASPRVDVDFLASLQMIEKWTEVGGCAICLAIDGHGEIWAQEIEKNISCPVGELRAWMLRQPSPHPSPEKKP